MPISVINSGQDYKIQSTYLYIQAAGSDTSDGSTSGVHLRWMLRNALEEHLPKGNLTVADGPYPSNEGFNKADDFVKVYRVPYSVKYQAIVRFKDDVPNRIVEGSGTTRSWEFDKVVNAITAQTVVTTVIIRFKNAGEYDNIRNAINPATNAWEFIKSYTGVLEVEALNKLSFAVTFHSQPNDPINNPSGLLRTEAIALPDTLDAGLFITCRKQFSDTFIPSNDGPTLPAFSNTVFLAPDNCNEHRVMAENITCVRFDYQHFSPGEIYVETYEDFFIGANLHQTVQWQPLGDFALSVDDNEVFNRLDNSNFNVDANWPRFNGINIPVAGAATVKVQNYKDKWNAPTGLKYGIQTYLEESRSASNSEAIVTTSIDTTGETYDPANQAQFDINYLEMLQMISMDYHNARMMGLGHIDHNVTGAEKFIYLSVYDTAVPLETGTPAAVKHFYMALPTGRADSRLPDIPVLKPLKYGLEIPSHPQPLRITDEFGYVPNESKRYISLFWEQPKSDEFYSEIFFESNELFCTQNITDAIFLGVEYRHSAENNWRFPELLGKPETVLYTDPAGYAEVEPVMAINDDTKPVYIHEETEQGQHVYALYAINWFSRATQIGNSISTDVTSFPKINTLLPPSNFRVQLIQKENEPIFTTPLEQDKLEALNPNKKEILVRTEFNWNHAQISAYQFRDLTPLRLADKVQLFFRADAPHMVRGKVTNVVDIGNDKVEVTVGSAIIYSSTSNPAGEMIIPVIAPGDQSKFAAAAFVTKEQSGSKEASYVVESVSQINPVIKFILKKNVDVSQNDISNSVQEFSQPSVNDTFAVIENLSSASCWPNNKLVKEVELVNFETTLDETGLTVASRVHRETVHEKDGTSKVKVFGGLFDKASIEPVFETVLINPEDINSGTTQSIVPGVFIIDFNAIQLAVHPDAEVEWTKGTVRIEAANPNYEGKKLLEVLSIDRTLSTLKLMVYDATAGDDDYVPIKSGTDVLVNYHPGYRAYFTEDATVNFNQQTILPSPGQLSKQTFMAIRAKDSTEPLESYIATPVILHAREINDPVPPGIPMGPLFATRPDFYGKSTYTFDTVVNTSGGRQPFAIVLYRANDRKILDELYAPETVASIINQLAALPPEDAAFNNSRWHDLVNVICDTDGNFKQYITPNGFRFPTPDNTAYKVQDANGNYIYPLNGSTEPGAIIDKVKEAITGAFLPLTEQPVLYRDIPNGYQTSGRKPNLYNSNGDRLLPGNAEYDPNPMAVKYVDGNGQVNVRFTDYTLDGSSTSIYFYYGQEWSSDMLFSMPGTVAGPIRMVNSYPAQAPQIRKFTTQLANPVTGDVTAVLFDVNSYIPSERITKIRIYRALNVDDARSIRTMKLAKEVTISNPANEVWKVMDDFSDEAFPLYGETLFYRLVAVRTISNEKDELENIPSLESSLVLASIVDVFNPPAPEISYQAGSLTTASPATLPGVKLKWNKVAHNATYYLYKMNTSGNWELLDKIKSNDQNLVYKPSANLVKEDEDGNTIYHRYKVDVENASGLLNLEEKAIVI